MRGISSNGKESIHKIVEDMFDRMALQFIGDIPKLKYKKMLLMGTKESFGLANLFVQAMKNKTPNPIEQDVLKSLLESAHGYIESLKHKTRSTLTERIDGIVKEATTNKDKALEEDIKNAISEEMHKARSLLLTTVEAESTKLRNVGTMMDISRVAADLGDSDPLVAIIEVRDGNTCPECLRLCFMPDGVTPRVYRFSELKQGYHKRGEDVPSIYGQHPHCRGTLTYIGSGFGFDKNGMITYIGKNHDEHDHQRQKK